MEGQRPLHVVPNNDCLQHELSLTCSCIPFTLDEGSVVVHIAYDRRETGEVCRRALDLLGTALAGHNHTWTDQEREAYEHAIHVLDQGWPKT